jgi:Cu(I)-responsive transcriptional regulator
MNIGEVSRRSGLSDKTIRYYESIDLVRPMRNDNGYRTFRESDLGKLIFLGRSRSLGFSIEDCRTLLQLNEDESRSSKEVKQIAQQHLDQIEKKITNLRDMQRALSKLVDSCAGDSRRECPILESLGQSDEAMA